MIFFILLEDLSWKHRFGIASGVSCALNFLYRSQNRPAFHRDIKSANIVITQNYRAKLIDCGLSMILSEEQWEKMEKQKSTKVTIAGGGGTMEYSCPRYLHTFKVRKKKKFQFFCRLNNVK